MTTKKYRQTLQKSSKFNKKGKNIVLSTVANSIFEFGFSFIRYFKSVVKFTFVGEASVVFSAIFHVNDTAKDIFPKSKTWKLTKSKGISFHLNFYSLILNFRVCFGTFLMVLNCSHYWYYWKLFKFSQPENNWFS